MSSVSLHRRHKWPSEIGMTPSCPPPISFTGQQAAQVLTCKSSPVTVILSSFIPLWNSLLTAFSKVCSRNCAIFLHSIVEQSRVWITISRFWECATQSQDCMKHVQYLNCQIGNHVLLCTHTWATVHTPLHFPLVPSSHATRGDQSKDCLSGL